MKKILALILALTLTFFSLSLVSCGGTEEEGGGEDNTGGELGGTENGGDSGGEGGGEQTVATLDLIKDGVANFNIVYSASTDSEVVGAIEEWISALATFGVEAKAVLDTESAEAQDCEILIGTDLVGRSEYAVDYHDFGEKGYVIKVQGDKVVIFGGSTDATLDVMTLFIEEYLGVNIATIEVTDVSIAKDLYVEKVQDDYPITSLTVKGERIKDMFIKADTDNQYAFAAAQLLQGALYTYAGAWIPVAKSAEDAQIAKSINVNIVADAGEDGFEVALVDGVLNFNCAYYNSFSKGMTKFINDVMANTAGTLDFDDEYSYTACVSVVRYSEYGAKGNGTVDDFDAIIKTHEFANECGQRVEADKGATYYIRENLRTAYIKTDVDWGDAQFIIDDREITKDVRGHWVFKVIPDEDSYSVEIPAGYSLKKTDTNIGLTFATKVMIHIVNANKKVYIRWGANSGSDNQQEMIVVESNGDLDPNTPLIFDYDTVTSMKVYPIDDKPLLIQGGTFTTYANQQISASAYYARGLYVQRSNTRVYNVTHLIDKEPETENGSCPYTGFFYVEYANNVTFDSCVMSSHKKYKTLQPDGDYVDQGTYDTQAVRCNNITWYNCTQANPIDMFAQGYWSVMASNFSKNLTYDKCVLSRFDAHRGVHNITIKDSEIGEIINIIGSGTALIENTTLSSGDKNYFVRIREDYGATWEGDIIIKNCKMLVKNASTTAYVIRADWKEWNFGYTCYVPNLYVDGFSVEHLNGNSFAHTLNIFKTFGSSSADLRKNEVNPLVMSAEITLKNIEQTYDIIQGTVNDYLLDDVLLKEGNDE